MVEPANSPNTGRFSKQIENQHAISAIQEDICITPIKNKEEAPSAF